MIQRIVKLAMVPNQPTGDIFEDFSKVKRLLLSSPVAMVHLLESKNHFNTELLGFGGRLKRLSSKSFVSIIGQDQGLFYDKPEAGHAKL